MLPAIPSPVSAGLAAPPRRSQQNSPPSTSRSVPGPSPASSRTSTTGCASTTSASRQAPAQTATSSFSTSPSSAPHSPNAACLSPASIPRSASWLATSRTKAAPGNNLHKPSVDHDFRSPGRRHRHPLRRLRPVRQSRLRGCRLLPRHPRLRCRQPGQMVAARRPRTLPRRLRTAGARRLRRQQRPTHPLLQVCLQTRLADPHHLKVTVCHYPSGASKWNPIDHRLFSEISKNWAGHPLRSYRTILNHIRTTTTDTGMCVTAQLVDQEYPKGVKISDAQFASIALPPHQVQPLRNYTICPRP